MDAQKQGKEIANSFLEIDTEKVFVYAISDAVADPALASLIWHAMYSLFEHCDDTNMAAAAAVEQRALLSTG